MKLTVYCLLVFWSVNVLGQDPAALRHVTTESGKADFYIQLEEKKVKYVDTLFYHWFKSQKIHITQGYASGNLLTGMYASYFFSGQLFERGSFENGLKTGEWKIWYESGQLKSITNYEDGVLSGNFFKYDENGKVLESGSYKSGKYHGDVIENGTVTHYKNGTRKEEKVKSEAAPESEKKEKKPFFKNRKEEANETGSDEKKFSFKKIFQKKSPEEKENKPKEKSEKDRGKRKSNTNEVAEEKDKRG